MLPNQPPPRIKALSHSSHCTCHPPRAVIPPAQTQGREPIRAFRGWREGSASRLFHCLRPRLWDAGLPGRHLATVRTYAPLTSPACRLFVLRYLPHRPPGAPCLLDGGWQLGFFGGRPPHSCRGRSPQPSGNASISITKPPHTPSTLCAVPPAKHKSPVTYHKSRITPGLIYGTGINIFPKLLKIKEKTFS
jgi:hypothetical protein